MAPVNSLAPFPPTFSFGVATADHQCEAASDAFGPDMRDLWEARPGMTARGLASDFWNRYSNDITLAGDLGCKIFRLSLSWARIESSPGVFEPAVIQHYRDVLQAIVDKKMVAMVTLHHNVWPVHVEHRGGMIADDFPSWFEAYARRIAKDLGDLIGYYVTINEPNQLVYGYVKGWWMRTYAMPPGMQRGADTASQMRAAGKLIRNLFLANQRAYDAIHEEQGTAAQVGSNPLLMGFPLWLQRFLDFNAKRTREDRFSAGASWYTQRKLPEIGATDVIVAQYTATPERAASAGLSEAYFVAHRAVLVRRGAVPAAAATWQGPIAVVRTTTAEKSGPLDFPKASFVPVGSTDEGVMLLEGGQVAALLDDDVKLVPYVNGTLEVQPLCGPDCDADEPYVAAVAPGNRDLLNAVDVAIKNFKAPGPSGTPSPWDASIQAHLPAFAGTPPTLWRRANLSDLAGPTPDRPRAAIGLKWPPAPDGSVLAAIQKRGTLRVGVSPDAPGLCMRGSDGTLTGLEVDLAHFMALQIFGDPSKVELVPLDTTARADAVHSWLRIFDPLLRIASVFSTILTSNWWHLGMKGDLPTFLCPKECAKKQDYVGLDYYWGISSLGLARLWHLYEASIQRYSSAPVWPRVLYDQLCDLSKKFPDLPLIVVENGCVDEADGNQRDVYLRRHVREVQRAVSDGFKVVAYLCWSITSNREWGLKFDQNSDFGLYYIALDMGQPLTRVATNASRAYAGMIEHRSA